MDYSEESSERVESVFLWESTHFVSRAQKDGLRACCASSAATDGDELLTNPRACDIRLASLPQLPGYALAKHVAALLALAMVVMLASMFGRLRLIDQRLGGPFLGPPPTVRQVGFEAALASLGGPILIMCGFVFLLWMYRAYANFSRLNVDYLRHSPLWAAVCWLIPFVNLVSAPRLLQEMWRASNPKLKPDAGDEWKDDPGSPLIVFFWTVCICSALFLAACVSFACGSAPARIRLSPKIS